jgi:hypothetical protein
MLGSSAASGQVKDRTERIIRLCSHPPDRANNGTAQKNSYCQGIYWDSVAGKLTVGVLHVG